MSDRSPEPLRAVRDRDDGPQRGSWKDVTEDKGSSAPAEEDSLSLRKELEAARREAAEAKAAAAQAVANANAQTAQAQYHGVSRAVENADTQLAQLKRDMADAYSQGDVGRLTEVQVAISDVTQRRAQLVDGKAAMEQRYRQQQQAPVSTGNAVEDLARTLSPASAQWLREHPDAALDVSRLRAAALHATQVKGHAPDSQEMFESIARDLGISGSKRDSGGYESSRRNRGGSMGVGDRTSAASRPVTSNRSEPLTEAEKAAAATSGISEAVYQQARDQLRAEGKLDA